MDGNLSIRGRGHIRGLIICTGSVRVEGSTGDFLEIEHDDGVVDELLQGIGQYRYAKAPFRVQDR